MHKQSTFPLVIILLSLLLVGVMVYFFRSPATNTASSIDTVAAEKVTIDSRDYQSDVSKIIQELESGLQTSQDDLNKLLLAESSLEALLALRVPAEHRDVHLDLVLIVGQIQSTLRSSERSLDEPLSALQDLHEDYSWL